jgi:hypothetical protein
MAVVWWLPDPVHLFMMFWIAARYRKVLIRDRILAVPEQQGVSVRFLSLALTL